MALTKYEYVKLYEQNDSLLLDTWIVVRLDGKCFHRFSDVHGFTKPNDEHALKLMNQAACKVMTDFPDIVLAYGQSDEYSFVFKKDTNLYKRRRDKLLTNVCSLFSCSYVFFWNDFFPDRRLQYPPTFDGRVVLYPTTKKLRDYLSWRQADCHVNNLYNTTFWTLVQEGSLTPRQAEEKLRGTLAADKNEILHSQFNMNYNNEPELFRKGSVIFKETRKEHGSSDRQQEDKKSTHSIQHVDIIGDEFWKTRSIIDD